MLACVQVVLDGSNNHAPALDLFMSKVREAVEGQFVEHLPDAEEFFGPRVKFCRDAELPDTRTRHKPQRRLEVVLDLLPVNAEIPQIIRVANANADCAILPRQPLRACFEQKSVNADILILIEKARG